MISRFIDFVQDTFDSEQFIPLHEPCLSGHEKQRLIDVLDSGYVSSVGPEVDQFEQAVADFVGTDFAVATVTGTAALHAALLVAGVQAGDEVITQALSFVATCNAIRYCGAAPVFIDVDRNTLGMSAVKLEAFLAEYVIIKNGQAFNKYTGNRIAACVPMHTFGHPCSIEKIAQHCQRYHIPLIEDAAEALGSRFNRRYCGSFSDMGVFSFNGNKIITTGGGGMVVTNHEVYAKKLKYLTTTAKEPHAWEFVHNELGYNYRMPNLNAALGLAQIDNLSVFVKKKRELAQHYRTWCEQHSLRFFNEPEGALANYWLNALILDNKAQRDIFLQQTNDNGVMTRPVWELLCRLPMYRDCLAMDLSTSEWLADRLVNIPSSVRVS